MRKTFSKTCSFFCQVRSLFTFGSECFQKSSKCFEKKKKKHFWKTSSSICLFTCGSESFENSYKCFEREKKIIKKTSSSTWLQHQVRSVCLFTCRLEGCQNSSKYFVKKKKIFFKNFFNCLAQIGPEVCWSLFWHTLSRQMPLVNWHLTALGSFWPGL